MSQPQLEQWLKQSCPFPQDSLEAMQGDASFRRYYRLWSGQQSYVVMDASLQRDCFEPYLAIAEALRIKGVTVPEIIAQDLKQGYMLLSDFGDRLYLQELQPHNADHLYKTAMDSLVLIQNCSSVNNWTLPAFDQLFMQKELEEFKLWVLERYLQLSFSVADQVLLQETFTKLTQAASQQPQVFIHRDYHSANLMVLPKAPTRVGVLDFQDACTGPVTYDLVSLLRDCYINWPDEAVKNWVSYYYEKLRAEHLLKGVAFEQFLQWFDWMGMQRHMKALFIFTRKYLRDHTTRYLQYLPRTVNYLMEASSRYPEFKAFHAYVQALSQELAISNPLVFVESGRVRA